MTEREAVSADSDLSVLFEEMANGLPLIVWVHGPDGSQQMVNDTFCEYFGVSREEMHGGRWQLFMHPDDGDAYRATFYDAVQARRPFHHEVRVRRADGEWRWIESWARPRWTADGRFNGMVGTSADITDRKRAEQALQEAHRRIDAQRALLEAVYGVINEGLMLFDADRVALLVNEANARLYGFASAAEMLRGHHTFASEFEMSTLDGRVLTLDEWPVSRVVRGERLAREELRVRRTSIGREWIISFSGEPIRDPDGTQTFALVISQDVTERWHRERELREIDRRKDEHLAMLGHELRNPIAAIRTAAELVGNPNADARLLRRAADVLARQSAHMAALVDGLLDIARIASGKIVLERATVDLRSIVDAVLADRASAIEAAGLTVIAALGDAPRWVAGDRVRLTQVVDNLLSNALKFTPAPGRIELALDGDDEGVELRVRDTGVGIARDRLQAVFEPFHQEAQDADRGKGGLGLGLALVRRLIELHGGRVEAHSAGRGHGAELLAWLPASAPVAQSVASPVARATPPRRILVVEDNADTADMLAQLLRTAGHEVEVAAHVDAALAILHRAPPDLVLCDIGLPGRDGHALARIVRADPRWQGVRLVALTGYGQEHDRRRAQAAGFDALLVKPADLAALQHVIAAA